MNNNPYKSPSPARADEASGGKSEGGYFATQIRQTKAARKHWSRNCWLIGLGSLFIASIELAGSRVFFAPASFLMFSAYAIAVLLVGLGVVTIAIGPHLWFWFRRNG